MRRAPVRPCLPARVRNAREPPQGLSGFERRALPRRARGGADAVVAVDPAPPPCMLCAAMDVLRTPDERFADLPGYPFAPRYVDVDGLRVHYVDEGPRDAAPVLLLHGEPSWCVPLPQDDPGSLAAAGHRVVAPDLVGFGRSDKPARRAGLHLPAPRRLDGGRPLAALDLRDVTLFCQDWGGLIGLRLVAEHPERFARVVAANTFLPTGDGPPSEAFLAWRASRRRRPSFPVGRIVAAAAAPRRSRARWSRAYDAPFPDERYKAGARQFPLLVPDAPGRSGGGAEPRRVGGARALRRSRSSPRSATRTRSPAAPTRLLQALVPGARGQPHVTIAGRALPAGGQRRGARGHRGPVHRRDGGGARSQQPQSLSVGASCLGGTPRRLAGMPVSLDRSLQRLLFPTAQVLGQRFRPSSAQGAPLPDDEPPA